LSSLILSVAAAAVAVPARPRRARRCVAAQRAATTVDGRCAGGLNASKAAAGCGFTGVRQLQGALPQPRSRVALRVSWGPEGEDEDEEDVPDHWFHRRKLERNPVTPAWTGYDTSNKVSFNEPAVFFFPRSGETWKRQRKDPDERGQVVPRLYKLRGKTNRQRKTDQRNEKRAWRKTSNRMQQEQRFKRFPRDESGKVTMGQFRKRLNPKGNVR